MCAQCARPLTTCYCQLIETKTNAWPVCIIQHVKEAAHAKGTARIAQLSLSNIKTIQLADRDPFVPPEKAHDYWQRPALIYPNTENIEVSREQLFDAIDEWHEHSGHPSQERTWNFCRSNYANVTQDPKSSSTAKHALVV